MNNILKTLESLIQPTIVLVALILILLLNSLIFKKIKSIRTNGNITKGAISFFLILIGVLAFILVLPIDKSLKGQILSFLGIIVSAGIALSSTTLLGNLIAGIMNNSMDRFRNGDLINIGDVRGRVVKKSVFHTEIQLEDSNFITVPNLYIANNPVKLIRKSNTVISTTVSLGYDIPRDKIESVLKNAAIETGLTDPYLYIMNLGDFSVEYKIHGFLEDSSKYFSTSSLLNAMVIDKLHEKRIEIVSPTFMNQKRVDNKEFVPRQDTAKTETVNEKSPEELVFDKANKSEKLETKKDYLKEIDKKQEVLKETLKGLKNDKEIEKIKSIIQKNEQMKEQLKANIKEQIERNNATEE